VGPSRGVDKTKTLAERKKTKRWLLLKSRGGLVFKVVPRDFVLDLNS
jgi:hypothetical protein